MTDLKRAVENIIEYFVTQEAQTLTRMYRGQVSKREFLQMVHQYIVQVLRVEERYVNLIVEEVSKYIWGYRILSDLIADPEVSDIRILAYDNIRIKKNGKRQSTNLKFDSPKDLQYFAEYCATKCAHSLSMIHAVANWTDRNGDPDFILRFNVTTAFVNSVETPYIHIRKIPKTKTTVQQLIAKNFMNPQVAAYLKQKVVSDGGMIWCGKGGSGKTTGMNAFLDEIPEDKSCLVIQENEELFSHTHPEMMFQHIVLRSGDGVINYDLKDLARNGLLMDLDYFVIGEIKGGEALYFLNASYTGHRCWASLHAMSAGEAMIKLADYAKYEGDYTREQVLEMLQDIRTIVFMKDFRVQEITEVIGFDEAEGNLIYKTVYDEKQGINLLPDTDSEGCRILPRIRPTVH
ncbi:MAG: CpaF family protein [Eubacterium sp.]|nr:CpaF family protein [Eubacterium sp.]